MVMSSVSAVVLPCVPFYLFPFRFSRSAHRLTTGRNVLKTSLSIPEVSVVSVPDLCRYACDDVILGAECEVRLNRLAPVTDGGFPIDFDIPTFNPQVVVVAVVVDALPGTLDEYLYLPSSAVNLLLRDDG